MVGRVIVHLGSMKTGSSSVQQFLGRNRGILKSSGFHLPNYALGSSHRLLTANFFGAEHLRQTAIANIPWRGQAPPNLVLRALARMYLNRIKFDALRTGAESVVLSAEQFSKTLPGTEFSGLVRTLRKISAAPPTGLIYVRNPEQYFASWYLEQVKRTGAVFDSLSWDPLQDLKVFLDNWARAYGAFPIVREFKPESFTDTDVIRDFLSALPELGVFLEPPAARLNANASISAEAALLISEYRDTHFPTNALYSRPVMLTRFAHVVRETDQALGRGRRAVLRPEIVRLLRESSATSVAWFQTRFDVLRGSQVAEATSNSSRIPLSSERASGPVPRLVEDIFEIDDGFLKALRAHVNLNWKA